MSVSLVPLMFAGYGLVNALADGVEYIIQSTIEFKDCLYNNYKEHEMKETKKKNETEKQHYDKKVMDIRQKYNLE